MAEVKDFVVSLFNGILFVLGFGFGVLIRVAAKVLPLAIGITAAVTFGGLPGVTVVGALALGVWWALLFAALIFTDTETVVAYLGVTVFFLVVGLLYAGVGWLIWQFLVLLLGAPHLELGGYLLFGFALSILKSYSYARSEFGRREYTYRPRL